MFVSRMPGADGCKMKFIDYQSLYDEMIKY